MGKMDCRPDGVAYFCIFLLVLGFLPSALDPNILTISRRSASGMKGQSSHASLLLCCRTCGVCKMNSLIFPQADILMYPPGSRAHLLLCIARLDESFAPHSRNRSFAQACSCIRLTLCSVDNWAGSSGAPRSSTDDGIMQKCM